MIKLVKFLFRPGDQRSKNIKIHTFLNFLFRGLGMICGFLTVSTSLAYIDKSEYGVWLTLTSITVWLAYIDVGLGNGMRNKVAEAIGKGDEMLAKEYVSTTYLFFSMLLFFIFILFAIGNYFLNWNVILRTTIPASQLLVITFVVVLSFCLRLILSLVTTVAIALQKVYFDSLINFLISFITLVGIYALTKINNHSFQLFCITLAVIPVVILLVFNYILFKYSSFAFLRPQFKSFNKQHVKGLLNVGIQFFFIQLVGIIIFSTDNILITQLFSAAAVTTFNVAYKYFSITTMVFSIVLLPYWSAFTNTYIQNDIAWIRNAFKKLLLFWVLQVLATIILIMASSFVFHLWVGDKVIVPFSLSVSLALYCIIFNWNNIFAYFINGISKIRLQLYSSVFVGVANIPLSYLLAKHTDLGVSAIVIANAICLLVGSVWAPIQCYKIIHNKASGIWNK